MNFVTPNTPLKVCVAGVTGDVGRLLTATLLTQPDLLLASAVARSTAGRSVGEILGRDCDVEIRASVAEALSKDEFDVLVDYTSARAAFENVSAAVAKGIHVVVGSSGITADQFDALDAQAKQRSVGVLHGNFAITAVLAQVFAACAARYVPSWEIIEYGHDDKIDAISGTARELASRLSKAGPPQHAIAPDAFVGDCRSRGATVQGTQVHAVRLPSSRLASRSSSVARMSVCRSGTTPPATPNLSSMARCSRSARSERSPAFTWAWIPF